MLDWGFDGPHLLCAQVTASSPSCRTTDPKGVVSGKFMRNNAAGQRPDGAAWWQIDLGAQHSLLCNYYTIRHDASTTYPRNWTLQVCQMPLICPCMSALTARSMAVCGRLLRCVIILT